jgi:hypothetical protein
MDRLKSWWILPLSCRYPPPSLPDPEDEGIGQAKGAICPGHFIPTKERHWNKIINRKGPLQYPPDMPLIHGEQWDMSWKADSGHDARFSANVSGPSLKATGANVHADASAAFEASISNYWYFDKLDTFMVQPWDPYIAQSLGDEDIDRYIKKHTNPILGTWEVYMISGIVVARGAMMNNTFARARKVEGHAASDVQGVVEGSLGADWSTTYNVSASAGKVSDFVWAIQIARVHRDAFHKDWEWETLWEEKTKGSTFALDGRVKAKQRFERALADSKDEGIANASVFGLETGNDVFILLAEGLMEVVRPRVAMRMSCDDPY